MVLAQSAWKTVLSRSTVRDTCHHNHDLRLSVTNFGKTQRRIFASHRVFYLFLDDFFR